MKRLTILLLLISLLVACTPSGEPAASEQPVAPMTEGAGEPAVPLTSIPRTTEEDLPAPMIEEPVVEEIAETAVEEPGEPSAPPETESAELPASEETAVDPVEAPAEETGPMVISGRLDEGAFFLGDPNAPVTLIDYSDFL
jgi:hypothetical protein